MLNMQKGWQWRLETRLADCTAYAKQGVDWRMGMSLGKSSCIRAGNYLYTKVKTRHVTSSWQPQKWLAWLASCSFSPEFPPPPLYPEEPSGVWEGGKKQ